MRLLFLLFVPAASLAACSAATENASPGADLDGGPGSSGGVPGSTGLPCDVDAVFAKICRNCHTDPPQFGAPMPLTSYAALHAPAHSDPDKKVYELVAQRIDDDADPMPPPPNPRLDEADRETLRRWAAAGAPSSSDTCGTDAGKPPPATVSCKPDLPLAPSSKWTMPAEAGDRYVCYGIDVERPSPTHVTAFAPRIDNTKIVHHLVLYQADESYGPAPLECDAGASVSWRMITGWAPGAHGMELPKDVGFPLEPGATTHYVMQIHYSNPQGLSGETDTSGFDLCTEAPRANEADVLAFGSTSFTIPATGQPYTEDCTIDVPNELGGMKMFAALPHMHKLGTAMATTLERGGKVAADLGTVDAWSFDRQAWVPISAETKGGDVIRTRCTWTNDTGEEVDFGPNTADEMCYSFTMYYPRIQASGWTWIMPALSSSCQTD